MINITFAQCCDQKNLVRIFIRPMCIAKKRIWFEAHLRYRFLKFQAPSQLQQVIVT